MKNRLSSLSLSTMTYMRNLKITYAKAPTSFRLKEFEGLRRWEYYKCGHFESHLRQDPVYINPYPTAFPYGNGMVLHFYQQQEKAARP